MFFTKKKIKKTRANVLANVFLYSEKSILVQFLYVSMMKYCFMQTILIEFSWEKTLIRKFCYPYIPVSFFLRNEKS